MLKCRSCSPQRCSTRGRRLHGCFEQGPRWHATSLDGPVHALRVAERSPPARCSSPLSSWPLRNLISQSQRAALVDEFLSYIRVSTERQDHSSLEAQQRAARRSLRVVKNHSI
jgi:hypothetical protein